MFLKSKKQRQELTRKLNLSKDKDKRSSQQKRRAVQANVDRFINTMNHFKNSRLSFKDNQIQNKTLDNFPISKSQTKINIDSKPQLFNTPTVKDIEFANNHQQNQSLAKQFYELQDSPPCSSAKLQLLPQKDNQIDFYKLPKLPQQLNINNIKEQHSSHRNSQVAGDAIQDQEIKLPQLQFINNSMNQSSNNNSDAIFFTSRFQDYLNNKVEESPKKQSLNQIQEKSPKKQQNATPAQKSSPIPPLNVNNQKDQNNHENIQNDPSRQDYIKLDRNLKNNASGHSLAFSNDSSLKLSLHQSAIHDVISRKLSQELVLESIKSPKSQPLNTFRQLCLKLQFKAHLQDFISFYKEVLLQNHINRTTKTRLIDNLMINRQLNFQLRKNEIKASHHLQNSTQNKKKHIFYAWKAITQTKSQSINQLIQKRQSQLKNRCFRTFKMLLFDRRINNQVDNYYLSKIFFAFKSIVDKEKKKMNQKIFKCYCRNLKRSMFSALVQGCNKSRREREAVEIADNHYYFSMIQKVFLGWKQTSPKQQKFIRLAMTTKNILKETKDHKLLQTKTFDFYQIK